ncbi:hypothetical protein EDB19DRAFT_1827168 [Suillus lakei]|nr:hypothetical protein EDB19DRAFT_1827168 [Suillus lakei]
MHQPSIRGPGILDHWQLLQPHKPEAPSSADQSCSSAYGSALSLVQASVLHIPLHNSSQSRSMAKEHQPVILGRIGRVSEQYTNRPIPRGVSKGPVGSASIGVGSYKPPPTSNTNFERPKPSSTIDELEGVTRQLSASSVTDTQDGTGRGRQRIHAGIFNRPVPPAYIMPEEDAQASRPFNVARRGGTAGAGPSYRVPPLPITGRGRDHILAVDRERDRHKSYANIDTPSSTPALSSSVTHSPGYIASANVPPVTAIIAPKKSVSFDDSSEQSSSSPEGWNGPPHPPLATKKSFSFDGGVQSTYPHHLAADLSPPRNRSHSIMAAFNLARVSEGWNNLSHSPYETRYGSSRSPETQEEVPQNWQPSKLHTKHSMLDIASGSPHYPVRPTNTHYEVSEREYQQALDQSGAEAQRRELEIRRKNEEETKRKEDEIKRKDMLAKKKEDNARREEGQARRREDLTRHVERAARRFGGEERRLTQDPTWQGANRREYEVSREDKDARLKEEATRAKEEEIRRKEGERTRWEEPHSLEDLTNKVQGRSPYPIASGGFGDIWKCVLVKPGRDVQVAVKTIRAFESDNKELVRKNSKRVRRELKVWERLKHDSILPLWGVANDFGPYPAMVCPWADNGALTGFLERYQDRLSSQDKFSLSTANQVVHGDLTGVWTFIGTSYFTNSVWGNIRWAATELYEAPENASLTTECDIYSFGSIILQVLTCKVPYYYVKNDLAVLGYVIKGKKPESSQGVANSVRALEVHTAMLASLMRVVHRLEKL